MTLDLILKDITDPTIRENFARIQRFITTNTLLGTDFKFFEVDIPVASYAYPIAHGLSFIPTDIISLAQEGDFNSYFRTDESDRKNIYIAAHGPVRLRFLVGRFSDSGKRPLSDSQLPFVAPQSTTQSSGTLSGNGSDGWAFIQDAARTTSAPLTLTAGTRTLIPNDGNGTLTNYTNAPANASTWWNTTKYRFYPSKLGEFYTFRLNFRVMPASNNTTLVIEADIGTSNSAATKTFQLSKGGGVESAFSETFPMGITQAPQTNGIGFYITASSSTSLYGINLTAVRDYHL